MQAASDFKIKSILLTIFIFKIFRVRTRHELKYVYLPKFKILTSKRELSNR